MVYLGLDTKNHNLNYWWVSNIAYVDPLICIY
jgi:hypothetical protein